MKTKTKVTIAIVLVLAAVLAWGIYARTECVKINARIDRLLAEPVSEDTEESVQRLDEQIRGAGFWGKLFLRRMDEYAALKAENDALVDARAEELTGLIAALEPCTVINSQEQYDALRSRIQEILADEDNPFDLRVKEKIPNYGDFEEYVADFYALVETYRVDCTLCDGTGRLKCGSCDGKGVHLITWYEHGDWGDKTYSTTDCTTCEGTGRRDCTGCSNGDVYRFAGGTVPGGDAPAAMEDYGAEDVVRSVFSFEKNTQPRMDYIRAGKDSFRILSNQEVLGLMANPCMIMTAPDNTSWLPVYTLLDYADGAGQWQEFAQVRNREGTNYITSVDRYPEEFAVEDGLITFGNGWSFEVREMTEGCWLLYKQSGSGTPPMPAYMLIPCGEDGTPLVSAEESICYKDPAKEETL